MIYRQNYHDVHLYLRHIEREKQNAPETVKRARAHLRHLLEWADETPLTKARAIDPTFPAYLLTARADGRDKSLAPASIVKCLANARQFFYFAHGEWNVRYKAVTTSWIDLLQPPRHIRTDSRLPIHEYWTRAEVGQVASVSAETLREERGKVAACMLFLSGMRADALASLPISCVDLAACQVSQLPERGVRTKNRKAAITYLLDIPELFEVVSGWDRRVRVLPSNALWYASLTKDGMGITSTLQAYIGRRDAVEQDLRLVCARAGLPYKSPHKLRHGHIMHALKQARNMPELKAISQNAMHSSVTITDQIYGNLLTDDVRNIIGELGKNAPRTSETLSEKITELIALLQR